ncbi:serine O-acetyltransferase [Buchnera aphidicola (Muscaphis stroyani)]|uniref:Serine acetyltransferase n=1 Tax=Buchnera aphidicola (Muscaphis stroyani) TaxID=1241869 RepID=A0A4D6Y3J3_9GAMM|nr:serine O-acetyltransferase [Buchnera aphidicola]QCI24166.1 serine O-acetyltransferase [Buchnera aphidicola (Muscaphis stroyani)]
MRSKPVLEIWNKIVKESFFLKIKEPFFSNFYNKNISKHNNFSSSLSYILADKLSTSSISTAELKKIFENIYSKNMYLLHFAVKDIRAVFKRDPVVKNYLTPLLYLKGFHALESYRISHYLWKKKKYSFSLYLQSRISSVFSVDIHPAASIGSGIMIDHASGVVIGERVKIEDNVSILHSVTLGGTGKIKGKNRHPIIRKGVVIGAGAKILGHIEVGSGSKIGAGSVVLKNVPSHVTVAGIPAKILSTADDVNKYNNPKKCSSKCTEKFQYGSGI